jgi:outer membrane protein TolC
MKKIVTMSLIASLSLASVLNNTKDKIFNAEINKTKEDSNALKNSWISPAFINMNYTKNTQNKISTDIKTVQIMWNQDIFRSGGIYYAIKYAKALGIYNLDLIKQQKLGLIKTAFTLKTQILRDKLLLKQNILKLANLEINVKVTKDNYLAGNADISDMNNILVQRDTQKMANLTLKQAIQNEIRELKKLTNKKFEIKNFPLITKDEYIKQNIVLTTLNAKSKSDYTKAKITTASYLPKLTVNLQASHSDYDSEIDSQDNIDNPWSAGLTLSMPLDINYKANIQSAKINYLKSKLDINDKKNELSQKYDEVIDNIDILQEKIKIAKQIQNSYKSLYNVVKEQFNAGLKTVYDVESLKNSLEIQNLEVEVQKYNITLQKIDLYFDVNEK